MPDSQIKLLEAQTRQEMPAAPKNAVLLSSASAGRHGLTVELHELAPAELPEHFVEGHRLIVAVQIDKPVSFEWKESGQWRQSLLKTGDFSLQTHGELNAPRWREKIKILAIALESTFVGNIFQDSVPSEKIAFQERHCQTDPMIACFAAHFKDELENASYAGKLYGESLAMAFSLHLLEKHGRIGKEIKLPNGKLNSAQLRRALEFIHDNLAEDLSIEEISGEAFLSAFHFARLFKNTIGLTPHQYVLQNRIERAKRIIAKSPYLNLTEIGLLVGFFD